MVIVMSTSIVSSHYESIVVDYLMDVEGYLCKTDIDCFVNKEIEAGRNKNVRFDVDVLAFSPKKNTFRIYEVLSYTPRTKGDKKEVKWKISAISSPDLERFLDKEFNIQQFEKWLVVWRKTDWVANETSNANINLISFEEIFQNMLNFLKRKMEEKGGWVNPMNQTMLVLETILYSKDVLKI